VNDRVVKSDNGTATDLRGMDSGSLLVGWRRLNSSLRSIRDNEIDGDSSDSKRV
jgi:hypothetical protein